jgi:hypothetical protein
LALKVLNYFDEKGYSKHSGETAFYFYENNNWKDSNNKQVENWKGKMISVWFKEENKISNKKYDATDTKQMHR